MVEDISNASEEARVINDIKTMALFIRTHLGCDNLHQLLKCRPTFFNLFIRRLFGVNASLAFAQVSAIGDDEFQLFLTSDKCHQSIVDSEWPALCMQFANDGTLNIFMESAITMHTKWAAGIRGSIDDLLKCEKYMLAITHAIVEGKYRECV